MCLDHLGIGRGVRAQQQHQGVIFRIGSHKDDSFQADMSIQGRYGAYLNINAAGWYRNRCVPDRCLHHGVPKEHLAFEKPLLSQIHKCIMMAFSGAQVVGNERMTGTILTVDCKGTTPGSQSVIPC